MANLITVRLQRNEGQPWGFRLQGGKDFSSPLVLQRVNGGSVADQVGLMAGDALVKVNSTDVYNLRHKEAQDVIMSAGNSFELSVSRGTAWRPSVTPTGSIPSPSPSLPGNITPVTKTSLAATPQPAQHIGSGHNQAAKPFPAQQQPQQQQQQQPEQVNGGEGPIKSIVNKQYNTPVAMYSDETIAETLSSQAEVLAGGVLGVNFKKNERVYSPANSEVYKMLHEQGDDPEPGNEDLFPHYFALACMLKLLNDASSHFYATQSHAIGGYATAGRLPVGPLTKPRSPVPPQMLHPHPQPQTQPQQPQQPQQPKPPMMASPMAAPAHAPAPASVTAPAAVRPAPQTAPRCGVPPRIHPDGVFVRIKDKNLHADCFKCATCGSSLKNQGYFNLNDKLYCDIHARLAALQSPPPGTNGMVPVTITKPGQKSGVSAISAALNAHANLNGRSQSPYATNHPPAPPIPSATATITFNNGGSGGSSGIGSSNTSSTQSPSHSRSSSTTSSSGYCNSSSLSPVQSNKVSPLHSRTSSENELILDPATATKPYSVQCDFSYLPPPPPSLLSGLSLPSPAGSMENPEAVEQPPVEAAADPASFGPNGLAVAQDSAADSTDAVTQNEYGFIYKTMGGALIRSVFPPGSSGRYQNQSNILPKPFSAPLPVSSHLPPIQPPASYPPVAGSVPTPFASACQAPSQAPAPASAPQPAVYPPMAAPAPAPVAAAPAAVPTQQGKSYFYNKKSVNPPKFNFRGDEEDQEDDEEEQVQKPAESPVPVFTWPPKRTIDEIVPLATPIYIPVPETQKVVVKPPERPREKNKSKSPPEIQQQQQQQQLQQLGPEEDNQFVKSVQSKSAPELSRKRSDAQQQQQQQQQEEESYETYTATTTSTSASSEEYQMYSTQTSQPIVTFYDTPILEMDYPFSSGQRSAQASTGAMSDASYTHFVFRDVPPEVESVEPSVEPSIKPEREKSPEVVKPQKRVEFVDYRAELDRFLRAEQAASEAAERLKQEMEEVAEEFTIPHYELPVIKSPNPMPNLPKPIVPNPVPKQWQSKLVQALCTAPKDPIRLTAEQIEEANFMKSRNEAYVREQQETKIRQLEALKRQVDALERRLDKKIPEPEPEPQPYPPLDIPRKGSVMARVLASSTTKAERFPKFLPAPFVPLPDDSTPYFPPPHSMEPIRSEKISSIRASPFLEALITAPYTPFQKFGTEIPSQMENMPVPSGRLSMTDALATAPQRPYTPFTEVKFERSEMYQELLKEQPSIQVDPEQNFSAFASVGGNRTPVPFKPIIPEIREPCEQPPEPEQPAPEPAPEPEPEPEPKVEEKKPEPEKPKKKLPPYPRKDAGSDHYSLAPRRETNSPLHQPAEIPNYQRKWYNLPTQNPPHTPEPEELRQNVPLAFVDTHSKAHLAKPIAQTVNTVNIRDQVTLKKAKPFTTIQNRTIPVIQTPMEEDAELAQYNQFNNAHSRLQAKGVIDRGQSFTPSLILTKHPTTIPYYQHQLGFEEYFAESKAFDGRRTPQPVRKSPAFGPPPNPLKGHVPPSRDDIPNESGLYLSMDSYHQQPQKKSPLKQSKFEPGMATTLLDNSVSKLASINGNSDYRKQASNVLKEMLEARLKKHDPTPPLDVRSKNKENLLQNGDTLPKRILNPSHPMSRIIDMCDSTSVPAPPPLPKSQLPFVMPQNGLHKDLNPPPTNLTVNSVVLRPKNNNLANSNNNSNGGHPDEPLGSQINRRKVSSELTSHARDRRSYVEKNNNNNNSNSSHSNQSRTESAKKDTSVATTTDSAGVLSTLVDKVPVCNKCNHKIVTGPFITALGRIWCPDHFICHNANCKRPLADIGFVEEKGDLYCEYCFEEFLAPLCSKCNTRVKGDCLNAIGKQFHPECFKCAYCGKLFGNSPFFLEEGDPYCEADWNELFTTKCFACGFPVEAGDKWVEALNNNYHSQCFNCTSCKKNLEGQSFFAKGGRPFCKNHAR